MRSIGFGLLFVTAAALVPVSALADDRQQSSFTGLIGKGFEVKSVTLVPVEVAKRVTEKVRTDNVIVTLQKQESVAVCYVAFANWAFMNVQSLDSPTLCEVRSAPAVDMASPPPPASTAEAPPSPPTVSPPTTPAEPAPVTPSTPDAPPSPPAPPSTNP